MIINFEPKITVLEIDFESIKGTIEFGSRPSMVESLDSIAEYNFLKF